MAAMLLAFGGRRHAPTVEISLRPPSFGALNFSGFGRSFQNSTSTYRRFEREWRL